MSYPLLSNFISILFICILSGNPALSKNVYFDFISNQLEQGLNEKNLDLLRDLFTEEAFNKFEKEFIYFTKNYQEPKWIISDVSTNLENMLLDIEIISNFDKGGQKYNVNSKQILKIKTYKNKISNFQVIKEESILKTYSNPIQIKINSPIKVLTGEKYEIDLIIEEPLDNSLIAGGMIIVPNNVTNDLSQQYFGLKPLGALGLFKSIQAPLKPGFQTISAIIAHPKGIYSITKKIEVGLKKYID